MNAVGIRKEILAQRRALGEARVAALSKQVIERFLAGCGIPPEAWKGLTVGLYRPLAGELDPRGLEAQLLGLGATLCFPRVLDPQGRLMEFAQGLPGPAVPWPKGAFGIEEPPRDCPAVDPARVDLVFVPGVAFGLEGQRIGMGAGFYDRFLPKTLLALRIALAFDFQLLPKLEEESWDQRVDWIWTERRQIQLRGWAPG